MKRLDYKFSTILWDVDGTLLDFEYSQRIALARSFEALGRSIDENVQKRYDEINESYWKRLEKGEVTRAELLPGRFVLLFREFHMEGIDVEAFRKDYQQHLGSIFCLKDSCLDLLARLSPHVRQYIVTNGVTSTQQSKLELSGIAGLVDGIFISEQLGADKPSIDFFEKCLDSISEKDKSRILIVGDSLSSDIQGGINAGIVTCWYRPYGKENTTGMQPDYEISHLSQIFDVINSV